MTENSPQANAAEPRTEPMTLEAALAALDVTNNDHWNQDGSPKVAVIEQLMDNKDITKADIAASPAYRTQNSPPTVRGALGSAAPAPAPGAPVPVTREEHERAKQGAANGIAGLEARIRKLEDDNAFLRALFGWPTKG